MCLGVGMRGVDLFEVVEFGFWGVGGGGEGSVVWRGGGISSFGGYGLCWWYSCGGCVLCDAGSRGIGR